jgi:hypothetical protein
MFASINFAKASSAVAQATPAKTNSGSASCNWARPTHRKAESTQQYDSVCASAMQPHSRQLPYAEDPRLGHTLHSSAGNNAAFKS